MKTYQFIALIAVGLIIAGAIYVKPHAHKKPCGCGGATVAVEPAVITE